MLFISVGGNVRDLKVRLLSYVIGLDLVRNDILMHSDLSLKVKMKLRKRKINKYLRYFFLITAQIVWLTKLVNSNIISLLTCSIFIITSVYLANSIVAIKEMYVRLSNEHVFEQNYKLTFVLSNFKNLIRYLIIIELFLIVTILII